MSKLTCTRLVTALLVLLPLACGAPEPESGDPSGLPTIEELLASSQRAMGGAEAISRIRSIRGLADCTGPNGPYTTEIQTTRDGELFFHQTREGEEGPEHYRAFVNGTYTWSIDRETGEPEPEPVTVRAMVRSHDFFSWALDFPFFLNEARVHDRTEVGGIPYFEVRLEDNFARPVRAFFHAETRLLGGLEMFNPLYPTELIQLRINDWRRVGDVLLPSRELVTDGSGDFELVFHEISVNDVDESLFEVPEEIREAAEARRRAREAAASTDQ